MNKGGRNMAVNKFYIVYSEIKENAKHEYSGYPRTFTKSDVCWFGIDERKALQMFKSLARRCGSCSIPHIKCVDLDSLPDYSNKKPTDDLIGDITKTVINPINGMSGYYLHTRATVNKDGMVTYSISKNEIDEARPNYRGDVCGSVIHDSKAGTYHVEEEAFNKVFEILFDKYIKQVKIIAPLKVKIDKKEYKIYKPTNEN